MSIFRSHLVPIMMVIPMISAFSYTAVTIYNQEYRQEKTEQSTIESQPQATLYPFPFPYQELPSRSNQEIEKKE